MGVSPFVNPATGTATCELEIIDKKDDQVLPGRVGNVTFRANIRRGFTIPVHALYYKAEKTFVRTVDDKKIAHNIPVVLGRKQRGQVEILEGITEGLQIIERASRFVAEGKSVKIQATKKKSEKKEDTTKKRDKS